MCSRLYARPPICSGIATLYVTSTSSEFDHGADLCHIGFGLLACPMMRPCNVRSTVIAALEHSAGADVRWRERLGETRVAAAEAAREAASAAARGVITSDQARAGCEWSVPAPTELKI